MALRIDTSAPHYQVTLRRGRLSEARDITSRVTNFQFTESGTRRANKVQIRLDNEDQVLYGDDDLMRKGSLLSCRFGYPGAMRQIGDFAIRKHGGSRQELMIEAFEAKRNTMMRKKQSRLFEHVRRSDVAAQIFLQHGIPRTRIDTTPDILPTITQVNSHDWKFLQRLADLEHYELYIDSDGGGHFERPRRGQRPARALKYVRNTIGMGIIEDYTVTGFGAGLPGRIRLEGWDPLLGTPYSVVADEGTADIEALEDTEDIKAVEEGDSEDRGNHGSELAAQVGMRSLQEAQALAKSLYKKYRYGALTCEVKTTGDPTLAARLVVVLTGIGPHMDGRFWIKEAVHELGNGGYGTTIKAKRDGLRKSGGPTPVTPPADLGNDFDVLLGLDGTAKIP